jgi:hypothetical protein
VLLTYPVIGRFAIGAVFLVAVALSVQKRGFLLFLAVANYVTALVGIDAMLVQQFGQSDRLAESLGRVSELNSVQLIQTFLAVFLPVLLAWIAAISVASRVRKRTRARVNSWVDERRQSIYGAEDQGVSAPTRVSILAVFSLITAIIFPILGLVLAYAARNDFVSANPRKSGLDLAVAATIIGWFGLGIQLLFVITSLVAGFVGGFAVTDLLFGAFSALFGFGALVPGGFEGIGDILLDAVLQS